jgi:hypothetical protein
MYSSKPHTRFETTRNAMLDSVGFLCGAPRGHKQCLVQAFPFVLTCSFNPKYTLSYAISHAAIRFDVAHDATGDSMNVPARDSTSKSSRDAIRDLARDLSRDSARDSSRDATRNHARDATRDPAGDSTRDSARDSPRDAIRDFVRDPVRWSSSV